MVVGLAVGCELAVAEGAGGGGLVSAAFTAGEILSALASNTLTCHNCVSFRLALKPGIPVSRMPFAAFQCVSQAGSSVTPVP